MSHRLSALDKAIKDLDDQITVLEHAREVLINLEAARPPKLKTVAK